MYGSVLRSPPQQGRRRRNRLASLELNRFFSLISSRSLGRCVKIADIGINTDRLREAIPNWEHDARAFSIRIGESERASQDRDRFLDRRAHAAAAAARPTGRDALHKVPSEARRCLPSKLLLLISD